MNSDTANILREKTKDPGELPPAHLPRHSPPIYRADTHRTTSNLQPRLLEDFATTASRFQVLRWDLQAELKTRPLRTVDTAPTNPLVRVDSPEHLPNPLAWSSNLSRIIFDVLGGRRELASLRRWIDPQLYGRVAARVNAEKTSARSSPVQVRSARLCKISPEIAEVSIVVEDQGRLRAAALRLEAFRGRWRVTALELG